MLKLFKSFTSALRSSDSSLLILPYSTSKQHYSPLSTVKQIQALEENQMLQYFKPFYQKQLYSISGFLQISSQLSFKEIMSLTKVQEWLDSNQYFIKLCPSQEEEMVPLGALCYSNVLIHREDLKEAITKHPSWTTHFPVSPPIIDICLGDFLVSNKKEKMLFISGEKSRVPVLNTFFKELYDGRSIQYPNASMMVYIPFHEGTHMSPQFREKILYNHQKYNGQCSVLAVGGLHNLNTMVKLKTGQLTSLRELLKSIPATPGMTRPLLFQHFEPNSLKTVHMAIYQKMDHDHVMERTKTLEGEIALVLAKGEENKVFINPTDGMWYGSIHQNKQGQSVKTAHLSRTGQEYARHINQLLNSPPKKRPQQTQMETNPHNHQFQSRPCVTPHQQHNPTQDNPKHDPRFQQIQEEFARQKQTNANLDMRINKLQFTTTRIDSNVDRILSILQQNKETTPPRSKKISRTTDNMECENYPDSLLPRQPLREIPQK
jgi:hypothetical protein